MVAKEPDPKVAKDLESAAIKAALQKEVKQLIDILETERKRRSKEATPKNIANFITDLGSNDFRNRDPASKALMDIGRWARPALWVC